MKRTLLYSDYVRVPKLLLQVQHWEALNHLLQVPNLLQYKLPCLERIVSFLVEQHVRKPSLEPERVREEEECLTFLGEQREVRSREGSWVL